MHVLIIPSWFSHSNNPLEGVFFREQAELIQEINQDTIGIVYCHILRASSPVSISRILRALILQDIRFEPNSIPVFRSELFFIPLVPGDKLFGAGRYLNFITRRINAHRLRKRYDKLLDRYIKSLGTPNLLHIQSAKVAGSIGAHISLKLKVPFILTEHWSYLATPNLKVLPNNLKYVYQNSQQNYAVSLGFCQSLSAISGTDFKLVPNFIDTNFFTPGSTQNRKKIIISSIGNLVKIKNFELLIRVFSRLASKNNRIELHIGGSGPELSSLKDLVKRKNMAKKVHFLGQLDRYQVRNLIRRSSVFVLPSIRETFGVVLIESLSCGVPVVAVRSWGPETIVTSDKLGYLCENSENSMRSAIGNILDNQSYYKKEVLRNHIVNNFSNKVVAQKMLGEYHRYANQSIKE